MDQHTLYIRHDINGKDGGEQAVVHAQCCAPFYMRQSVSTTQKEDRKKYRYPYTHDAIWTIFVDTILSMHDQACLDVLFRNSMCDVGCEGSAGSWLVLRCYDRFLAHRFGGFSRGCAVGTRCEPGRQPGGQS